MFRTLIFIAIIFFPNLLLAQSTQSDAISLANQYSQKAQSMVQKHQADSAYYFFQQASQIYMQEAQWEKYLATQDDYAYQLAISGKTKEAIQIAQLAADTSKHFLGAIHQELAKNHRVQATAYYVKSQYNLAEAAIQKAIDICAQLADKGGDALGKGLAFKGLIHQRQKKYSSAIEYLHQSLEAYQSANMAHSDQIANVYDYLGNTFRAMGDYPSAQAAYHQSLIIYQKTFGENHKSIARSYHNQANLLRNQGFFRKAREYYEKAIDIFQNAQPPEQAQIATAYFNFGRLWYQQGYYETALEYYQKSLSIARNHYGKEDRFIAILLNALGNATKQKKDYSQSLEYYQQSLEMRSSIYGEKSTSVATAYHNLGSLFQEQKKYDQALRQLQKSLELKSEIKGAKDISLAIDYLDMGELYQKQKNYPQALAYFQKALNIQQIAYTNRHYDLAYTYNNLAKTYLANANYQLALQNAQLALIQNISHFDSQNPEVFPPLRGYAQPQYFFTSLMHKIQAWEYLFKNEANQKYLVLAYQHLLKADTLLHQMSQQVQTQEDKFLLSSQMNQMAQKGVGISKLLYELQGDKNYLYQAFHFSERSKAQVLRDNLAEVEAREFSEIPPELREKEEELRSLVIFYGQRLALASDSASLATYQDKLFDAQKEHQQIIQGLEQKYPTYYSFKYDMTSASVLNLQSSLDKHTALISYILGDSSSYAFVINKEDIHIISLPPRHVLEQKSRNFYEASQWQMSKGRWAKFSQAIYQSLFAPLESHLSKKKKLIIIPDGILLRIPWESLLYQSSASEIALDFSQMSYLISKYNIRYHYAASLWYNHQAKQNFASSIDFLGFAPFGTGSLSASNGRDAELRPLPESEKEVKGIFNLFQNIKASAKIHLAQSAHKSKFLESASQARILHIASHSVPDIKNEKLARIAFAGCDDLQHQDITCFLYSGEIYNLKLNTELIVLSSCESGIGKLLQGEGIFSLARSFLYAGSQNILFSLWDANDLHTKDLMLAFYQSLIQQGKSYSTALQDAKKAMAAKGIHPRHWSNFLLIGQ